ncbi:MAG: UTP--glucose-1-phosphate uridylyltransferase [Acidobacteria bacterium]|nr:UTP--glucose-1-phosphate uridylyltransferase [Acidobacteriota bacterium]
MRVPVAVIPAAGRGTRMRPATRSVPKALLPVVDRPVIQWVVEEGMRAGVGEFVVVVSPGVEDLLYSHFEGMESLEELKGLAGIHLTWVVQEEARGLGHAVLQARAAVDERPFFCLLGDNLVVPGRDQLSHMAEASDGRSVVCLRPLPDEGLDRYGVAAVGAALAEQVVEVTGAVEKPGRERAPSRLGFVGRYLFTPEIFPLLASLSPGLGGEIQLTDAIARLGEAGRCLGWVADEDLLDVGNPVGFVEATTALGLWHPAVKARYREFLEALVEGP